MFFSDLCVSIKMNLIIQRPLFLVSNIIVSIIYQLKKVFYFSNEFMDCKQLITNFVYLCSEFCIRFIIASTALGPITERFPVTISETNRVHKQTIAHGCNQGLRAILKFPRLFI